MKEKWRKNAEEVEKKCRNTGVILSGAARFAKRIVLRSRRTPTPLSIVGRPGFDLAGSKRKMRRRRLHALRQP
jgi:hypothetical protein